MTSTTRNSKRPAPDEEAETSSDVTEAQVDEFLRKVLDVQRRYFYETDRRTHGDRRAELRKQARIILGADKKVTK